MALEVLWYHKRVLIIDSTIKIWDLETTQRIRTLEGHKDVVMCLQFDRSKIISGGDDKSIRFQFSSMKKN